MGWKSPLADGDTSYSLLNSHNAAGRTTRGCACPNTIGRTRRRNAYRTVPNVTRSTAS